MSMSKGFMDVVSAAYGRFMSGPRLARLNEALLKATLRARGYQDWGGSGEAWFVGVQLPKLDPRVVLDVGANVGDYAQRVLDSTSATVHCFEPQPSVAKGLAERLAPLGARAVVVPRGVGAESGVLELRYNPDSSELASFSAEVDAISYVRNVERIEVPVVSLDDYAAEAGLTRVDLIKIDTEGFEREVLLGAERVLRELRPALVQLEFNWHHLLRGTSLYALAQLLPDYDCYQLVPRGWVRRDPMDPLANVYRQTNFVFVRRGVVVP